MKKNYYLVSAAYQTKADKQRVTLKLQLPSGLITAKKVIETHGSTFCINSTQGVSTVAEIRLPYR
jgi:hypothetical protein